MTHNDRPDAASARDAKDARDWIVRLGSGAVTEAELARFRAWRDSADGPARAFAHERALWQALGAPSGALRPMAAGRRPIARRAVLIGGGAVAAPALMRRFEADYRTVAGEQRRVSLPDGSVATLNTESAIALRYRAGLRLVRLLDGEAMFEVRRDAEAPFRVAARGGNTEAIGTAFAVRAAGDQALVTVAEGRVRVSAPAAPDDPMPAAAVMVAANQQTRYGMGRAPAPAAAVDPDVVLAWRSGRIVFEGRPFAAALAELGRYVPERIVLADRSRAAEPVSAVFSVSQALAAIEALAATQHLAVHRIPMVAIVIS